MMERQARVLLDDGEFLIESVYTSASCLPYFTAPSWTTYPRNL